MHRPQCYSAMVHLKAVRLFVESVLRYGVPPNFQAVLLKPKKEMPLRKVGARLGGQTASPAASLAAWSGASARAASRQRVGMAGSMSEWRAVCRNGGISDRRL